MRNLGGLLRSQAETKGTHYTPAAELHNRDFKQSGRQRQGRL